MSRRALILAILLLTALPAVSCGSTVKAYFNGQEATVNGVGLPEGEPFSIDLTIVPDRDAYVGALLDEPGTTQAYDRRGGDAKACFVDRGLCRAGLPVNFSWTLAANGNWIGGDAPLNIYYQIDALGEAWPTASGYFTVVNAQIRPGAKAPEAATSPGPSVAVATLALLITLALASNNRGSNEVDHHDDEKEPQGHEHHDPEQLAPLIDRFAVHGVEGHQVVEDRDQAHGEAQGAEHAQDASCQGEGKE